MSDSTGFFDEPGPRARRRIVTFTIVAVVIALGVVALMLSRLASRGQLEPERWAVLFDSRTGVPNTLAKALWATLQAALLGMVFSLLIGILLAVARLSRQAAVRWPATVVVQFFRGLPLMLLIFFSYLALPSLGVHLGLLATLVISLVAYNSSVLCEVIRAGVVSIGRGQREAGLSLGLTEGQVLRSILLPEAMRRMLPTIVSQLVILLKDTSLGFVISYAELLSSGTHLVEYYGNRYALQLYLAVAAVYIAVNCVVSGLAALLARRRRRDPKGRPAGPAAPALGPVPRPEPVSGGIR